MEEVLKSSVSIFGGSLFVLSSIGGILGILYLICFAIMNEIHKKNDNGKGGVWTNNVGLDAFLLLLIVFAVIQVFVQGSAYRSSRPKQQEFTPEKFYQK
jgi:hypothetical protein